MRSPTRPTTDAATPASRRRNNSVNCGLKNSSTAYCFASTTGAPPRLAPRPLWPTLAGSDPGPTALIKGVRPMMHPSTALRFISEEVGQGVVALSHIPAGTITWVQDELDRAFLPTEVVALGEAYAATLDKYCFRNQHGHWILCWDHAKFVNHSFRSNCLTTAFNFEIAVRDIAAGEELTDDYGYLNVMRPFEALDEGVGRTTVYPDDLVRRHAGWDECLRRAWPSIPAVDQPLRRLISTDLWDRVGRIARDPSTMPSILGCYFDDAQAGRVSEVGTSSNGVTANVLLSLLPGRVEV